MLNDTEKRVAASIFTKRRVVSALLLLILVVTAAYVLRPKYVVVGQINCPSLVNNIKLLQVNFEPNSYPRVLFERLVLQERGVDRPVNSLWDLKGSVKIATPDMALQYVRLLSLPETYRLWRTEQPFFVEAITIDDLRKVSSGPIARYFDQLTPGYMGVLTADGFAKCNLTKPTVVRTPTGYQIERWCLSDGNLHHRREQVSEDGGYSYSDVSVRPIPKIAGITFGFPSIE